MDTIFQRESKNFLTSLQLYISKKITYDDLCLANLRLEASKFNNMDEIRKSLHHFKLSEYKKALELEKLIGMAKEEPQECLDIEKGLYIGCTVKNEYNTSLPPYPLMNMLTYGGAQEEVENEKVDDYKFEF